eukprot:415931-Rhodomonas_salina.1
MRRGERSASEHSKHIELPPCSAHTDGRVFAKFILKTYNMNVVLLGTTQYGIVRYRILYQTFLQSYHF